MTAMEDFTAILTTLMGRTPTAPQLVSIGASFVQQDPYQVKGYWVDTTYFFDHADVVDGGTGYAVDDILTVVGGTGTAATLRVTGESAGVITTLITESGGDYTVAPTNPFDLTGGTGTLATASTTPVQFDTPRDPTNEETAQTAVDTFSQFGRRLHREAVGNTTRDTLEEDVDAQVEAAQDAAEDDFN